MCRICIASAGYGIACTKASLFSLIYDVGLRCFFSYVSILLIAGGSVSIRSVVLNQKSSIRRALGSEVLDMPLAMTLAWTYFIAISTS